VHAPSSSSATAIPTESQTLAGAYPSSHCASEEYPLETMIGATRRTITEIMKLQYSKLGSEAPRNSLNLCLTDGKKMIATGFRNHAMQQPPSLYWSRFGVNGGK
jgi:hypothetical protein